MSEYRFSPVAGSASYRAEAGAIVEVLRAYGVPPLRDHWRVRFPSGVEREVCTRDLLALANLPAPTGTLVWNTGGYPHTYRPSRAGRFGCDPCWGCGQRPAAGAVIWTNDYGDLYCDPCARRNAGAQVEPEAPPASLPSAPEHGNTAEYFALLRDCEACGFQ